MSADGVRSASWRRRLAVLAAAALVIAPLVAGVLSVTGPTAGPDIRAARLVPADALLYLNVSTDPSRPAVRRLLALSERLPGLRALAEGLIGRFASAAGGSSAAPIPAWLGDEAAFALLNTPGGLADSLLVLKADTPAAARAAAVTGGAVPAGSYRGTQLLRYVGGSELALSRGFALLGPDAAVRSALDVAAGARPSLAAAPAYRHAAAGEPAGRVLDAWASAAGLRRAIESRPGLPGAIGTLLDQPALTGVAAALTPGPAGLTLRLHSALDPSLASLGNASEDSLQPALARTLPRGTVLLLESGRLSALVPRLLAAGAQIGIAARLPTLLRRLGGALAAEGVDVQSLRTLFDGDGALAVIPPQAPGGSPALALLAHTADTAAAQQLLAELVVPLSQLFPAPGSGPGQEPLASDAQIGPVTAHELTLTPGLQLDYAVFSGTIAIATSRSALAAVIEHTAPLSNDPHFLGVTGAREGAVASLLFADPSQLLNLGEQTGLVRSAQAAGLSADLGRIRAVGLISTRGEDDSTAELYLQIP